MNLLAMDTSTSRASVAVSCGSRVFTEVNEHVKEHAANIIPMVERVLHDAQLSLSDIEGLVVGQGPGSFTGLRIACSVVQGFAVGCDLPVYPVSGLAAIAFAVHQKHADSKEDYSVLALIDARMNQLYGAIYDSAMQTPGEWVHGVDDITWPKDQPLRVAGVGLAEYWPQWLLKHPGMVYDEVYPDASTMIAWVKTGKIAPLTAAQVQPVYVRNQVTQGK